MVKTVWQIDPAHTTVEFAVKHMMFTTVRGRFRDLRGTIELDEDNPDDSQITVEIEAESIDTGADARDTHLRSADFLDVERHPKITFESRQVKGARFREGDEFAVIGQLTIRGTSMEVTLEATYQGQGTDPWGGTRAGFSARAEIDRREWGLRWNQALETGGILVGNNVKIEIDAQVVRQEAAARSEAASTEQEAPSPSA